MPFIYFLCFSLSFYIALHLYFLLSFTVKALTFRYMMHLELCFCVWGSKRTQLHGCICGYLGVPTKFVKKAIPHPSPLNCSDTPIKYQLNICLISDVSLISPRSIHLPLVQYYTLLKL